jgi:hypothetical protein
MKAEHGLVLFLEREGSCGGKVGNLLLVFHFPIRFVVGPVWNVESRSDFQGLWESGLSFSTSPSFPQACCVIPARRLIARELAAAGPCTQVRRFPRAFSQERCLDSRMPPSSPGLESRFFAVGESQQEFQTGPEPLVCLTSALRFLMFRFNAEFRTSASHRRASSPRLRVS